MVLTCEAFQASVSQFLFVSHFVLVNLFSARPRNGNSGGLKPVGMQPGPESGNSGFCCSSETRIKPYAQRRAHGSCSHPHTYKSTFRQRHFPLVNLPAGRQSKCIVLNSRMGSRVQGGRGWGGGLCPQNSATKNHECKLEDILEEGQSGSEGRVGGPLCS